MGRIKNPEHAISFEAVLGKHGRPQKGEEKGDNVTFYGRGNSSTYTKARLSRDHPHLAEQVNSGEKSAHAAAIEAGFRKRVFAVPDDVDAAVDR